jgi:hypothetical protein
MFDCDNYENLYEPSKADETLNEYQEKMKELLLNTVKVDIETYQKRIDELLKEKEKMMKTIEELRSKEYQFKQKKSEIERQVRNERLSNLMCDFKVIVYQASNIGKRLNKCDKCNDKREIEFTSPSGKLYTEYCECNKTLKFYQPEEKVCKEFKINISQKDALSIWYTEHCERDNDDYYTYYSTNYADEFYSEDINFEDIDSYKVYFKTIEDCQKYCDYLNNKEELG